MTARESAFQQALITILTEIFDGPPRDAYLLNPGDPGLLNQLETIDASTASTRLAAGRPTLTAHIDHLQFGLALLNRWAAGERDPWADADWDASWQRTSVTDEEWRVLRDALRADAAAWRKTVVERTTWDDLSATIALSTAAHTAYHLGAIRQILAAAQLS